MNSFTLKLYDSTKHQTIAGVSTFVGEDDSGSFAILPRHARMMTNLVFGLSRFRLVDDETWHYLAMPGAALYFVDDYLHLMCRHYFVDTDYERISQRLADELLAEEGALQELHDSLRQMEEAMFRRMWELGQQGVRIHE
jgi:F-type H+-transporting ATPase subunit epsilon